MQITLITTMIIMIALGAQSADLKTALSYAYINNPTLQSQREDLKNAAEQTSEVLAEFMPNISWNRSITRSKNIGNNAQPGARQYQNTMSIQQELFHGGASLAALKTQHKVFDAQVQDLIFREQDFITKAIHAYLSLLRAKEALDINNNNVELYKQILNSAEEQFKYGQLTLTDVATAKANLANAKAEKIKANSDHINAKVNYKTYFGQEPDNITIPEFPNNQISSLENLIEDAKNNHPGLLKARASVDANRNNIWSVTAGSISPSLKLEASGNKINYKSALPTADENSGNYSPNRRSSKQLTLNFTVPIYKGGAEYSKIRQSKIAYQKSQFDASVAMTQIIQNAISAWQDFETQKESLKSYEEQLEAATVALNGAKQEFAVGVKTLVDMLNAEQTSFKAKLSLSTAKYSKLEAAFGLYAATGKLTAKGLNLPVEYFDPSKYYLKSWNILPNIVTSN